MKDHSRFAGTFNASLVVLWGLASTASAATPEALAPAPADLRAAAAVSARARHARPADLDQAGRAQRIVTLRGAEGSARVAAPAATFTTGPRYPGDLTDNGGAVLKQVVSHPIYLDRTGACTVSSCWGDPEGFLRDLGRSDFIHVVDEYVGVSRDNRYTVTPGIKSNHPNGAKLTDTELLGLVHAAAVASGKTGYGHMYHVFLSPGTDLCFDDTYSVCYSPDNASTFSFCAYHGYADFADIGHVIYSAEPYQNVPGCQVRPGTPNGTLADSTNDTLSHELFEAITDPDLDAWWNSTGGGMYGQEIGDECWFYASGPGSDPSLWTSGGKFYTTQP